MSDPAEIVVVGSINLDISVVVDTLPKPGETILGGDALWNGGGKGANQAVAAAKLGRRVAMIGAVGADSAGADQISNLASYGVDTSGIVTISDVSTGLAMIVVDAGAENNIVVSPGANGHVGRAHLDASHALDSAAAVLVQYEIPVDAVEAVAERCDGRLILNPAPARSTGRAVILAARAVVPNQGELAQLVGLAPATTHDELVDQARMLDCEGAVVITLGADGALIVENNDVTAVASRPVEAIDTTAAGDSFCAGLADGLVGGASTIEAVEWASRVAAITVQRRGAQGSLPTRAEVVS